MLKLEAIDVHGSAGTEQIIHAVEAFLLDENVVVKVRVECWLTGGWLGKIDGQLWQATVESLIWGNAGCAMSRGIVRES